MRIGNKTPSCWIPPDALRIRKCKQVFVIMKEAVAVGFPARIPAEGDSRPDQTCSEHCRNVADYSEQTMALVGLASLGYLAGLIHDMGKFKKEFAEYLADIKAGVPRIRGSVNHTFCAPRFVLDRYHSTLDSEDGYYASLVSELVAFAAGSHHGLFDCIDPDGRSGFEHRLGKQGIGYEESVANFLELCAWPDEVECLFQRSMAEVRGLLAKIGLLLSDSKTRQMEGDFYTGLLARLLLSAVIDADRRDAAEYDQGEWLSRHEGEDGPRWEECESFAAKKHAEMRAEALRTPLNSVREDIYRQCLACAERREGVYRLNVPTGGGKTLSVLAYALRHAKLYGKKRIIFTFPLLTILDQNARVIRDNLPGDGECVLEHHSNVVRDEPSEGELSQRELLVETWDAPVIVTTMVQFLDTLFSGKSSCIRRFQSLCDSLIVIDEVQTVPLRMVSLFNLAVNFLSAICGATVILCSATQPSLGDVAHSLVGPIEDMVVLDDQQKRAFKRAYLVDAGSKTLDSIGEYALDILEETRSLLIICNMKSQAVHLFRQLKGSTDRSFHLSAGMCRAHREDMMCGLRTALGESRSGVGKVLCVATQVIEAGVDISFERVIRLTAGLDSIIQAAGRQNREGESPTPGPVSVITCSDESLSRLKDIEHAKTSTENVLYEFSKNPGAFGGDLSSEASVKSFYHEYYHEGLSRNSLDYPLDLPSLRTSILSLLSDNVGLREDCQQRYVLNQSFKTAGKLFKVFDDDTVDVIVPYGKEGNDLIAEFGSEGIEVDFSKQKMLVGKAKSYCVSLRRYQVENLLGEGALVPKCDGLVLVLQPDHYDQDCGFVPALSGLSWLEV